MPLRLWPVNTAPGRTESPLRQRIATVSSAHSAGVGRSVISAYTASGLASICTVAVGTAGRLRSFGDHNHGRWAAD
jgi:hypothetical protein